MENEITNAGIGMEPKLCITSVSAGYLKITYKWATFLSILGFIGSGIICLIALAILVVSPFMGSSSKFGSTFGFPMILIGVLYLVFGILYFFPAYYLYHFSNKMKVALELNKQETLDESFHNLKKMFRFLGIMTIILISAYLIMIPVFLFISFSKNMGI
jgi:hypothetical protein